MSREQLDNLVKIGSLKTESSSEREVVGLITSGLARLHDAKNDSLNIESRFDLANEQWRVLDQAHRKRNLAEYEGEVDIDSNLLAALIRVQEEQT